jgi:hypothetical protein
MTDQVKQEKNKPRRDEKGRLLPGNTANPNGRPKGKTIKELVREHLESHPKDMKDFVAHFIRKNRELAWQMLEGRPQQDIVSDGKQLPTPIYGGLSVPGHDSDKEDIQPQKED